MPNLDDELRDPLILKALTLLAPVPEREDEDIRRGRDRFIREVGTLGIEQNKPGFWSYFSLKRPYREGVVKPRQFRFAYSLILTVLVSMVLLFGGAAVTGFAAQSALPGDRLYGFKTRLEQTQVNWNRSDEQRVHLYLSFAKRRLDEINLLIVHGRFQDILPASAEYEYYIDQAIAQVKSIAEQNPALAIRLSIQVTNSLGDYSKSIQVFQAATPADIHPPLQLMIQYSEDSIWKQAGRQVTGIVEAMNDTHWKVDGIEYAIDSTLKIDEPIHLGDLVRMQIVAGSDGSLVIVSIKRINPEQNGEGPITNPQTPEPNNPVENPGGGAEIKIPESLEDLAPSDDGRDSGEESQPPDEVNNDSPDGESHDSPDSHEEYQDSEAELSSLSVLGSYL